MDQAKSTSGCFGCLFRPRRTTVVPVGPPAAGLPAPVAVGGPSLASRVPAAPGADAAQEVTAWPGASGGRGRTRPVVPKMPDIAQIHKDPRRFCDWMIQLMQMPPQHYARADAAGWDRILTGCTPAEAGRRTAALIKAFEPDGRVTPEDFFTVLGRAVWEQGEEPVSSALLDGAMAWIERHRTLPAKTLVDVLQSASNVAPGLLLPRAAAVLGRYDRDMLSLLFQKLGDLQSAEFFLAMLTNAYPQITAQTDAACRDRIGALTALWSAALKESMDGLIKPIDALNQALIASSLHTGAKDAVRKGAELGASNAPDAIAVVDAYFRPSGTQASPRAMPARPKEGTGAVDKAVPDKPDFKGAAAGTASSGSLVRPRHLASPGGEQPSSGPPGAAPQPAYARAPGGPPFR